MLDVDIQKAYGRFLLQASFTAENGMLALLGASGSGKSVTLRCIAGIDRPDEGRIVLDGRVLFDSEKRICLTPQQRHIGYLFQQYALFPNMTVEQNLAAGLRMRDKETRRARVRDAIRAFRLEGTEKSLPHQLSGGQQQRTALARILLSEPNALLLDEPYAALDGHLKWQLEQELAEMLSGFSGTTVFVTHDADEVYRACHRVVVMDAGVCSPVTEVSDLFSRPETVSAAKLAGCHTLVPAVPAGDGQIRIPAWNAVLKTVRSASSPCTMGVFDDRLYLADTANENRIPCRVLFRAEERSRGVMTLLPVDAEPGAPLLRMALPREVWYTCREAETVCVAVRPADILLLQ